MPVRPERGTGFQPACGLQVRTPCRAPFLDVVVSELEFGRATRQIPHAKVWTAAQLSSAPTFKRSLGGWAVALLRHKKIRHVLVRGDFPLSAALFLKKHGIRVETGANVYPNRMIKTPEEIRKIRHVQRAARVAVREATRLIKSSTIDGKGHLIADGKPLTSERVRERIRETVLKFGCLDVGTIVAGGRQGADPHEVGTGVLRANEFIVIDVFPYHLEYGYWGDITRTVMRGKPTKEQARMYKAVAKAQRLGLSLVKPGAKCCDVHRRVAECLKDAGFETTTCGEGGTPIGFFHGTGHGVGLEIHEAPSLSLRCDTVLKEGMVVTVEPGLYYPELGGVRIEDLVVVGKSKI